MMRTWFLLIALILSFVLKTTHTPNDIPYQTGWPQSTHNRIWFSSPTLIDLDGNGDKEVLVGNGGGQVYVWQHDGSPHAGSPWETGRSGRINGPLAVGDIDGDGDLEVAAGDRAPQGEQARVYLWDHNGNLLSGWPVSVAWETAHSDGRSEVKGLLMADLDGDGDHEIVAGTTNNKAKAPLLIDPPALNLYVWQYDGSVVDGWPTGYRTAGIWGIPSVGNLDGDSQLEVVTGRDHHYVYAYDPDGTSLTSWPVRTFAAGRDGDWGSDPIITFVLSAPIVADLGNDGQAEYIVAGRYRVPSPDYVTVNTALMVFDAAGERRPGWETPVIGNGMLYGSYLPWLAPVVADLDEDGDSEIIITALDGYLHVYHADGSPAWHYNFASGQILFGSEPIIGDIDGDDDLEILFGTYDPVALEGGTSNTPVHVWALHHSGTVVDGFPLTVGSPGVRAAPTLGDLDGDGDLELLVGGLDNKLYVWDLSGATNSSRMPWPTGRHDPQRSGYPGSSLRVNSLRATAWNTNTHQVTLQWIVPGDSTTTATAYALRHAAAPIFAIDDWESATPLNDLPAPATPGQRQSMTVTVPSLTETVYFAMRIQSNDGRWHPLSNLAFAPAWPVYLPVILSQ